MGSSTIRVFASCLGLVFGLIVGAGWSQPDMPPEQQDSPDSADAVGTGDAQAKELARQRHYRNMQAALDAAILGESGPAPRRTQLEGFSARFTFLNQFGEGYQSQAGPIEGPGDERLLVYQPAFEVRFRSARSTHAVQFAFDAVTSASADALDMDVMSSASRNNEAGELIVTHTADMGDDAAASFTYGVHLEEHWRTLIWGMGLRRQFLGDTITLSADLISIYDTFDRVLPSGNNQLIDGKMATSLNLAYAQIVSPTTVLSLGYGFTYQVGILETSWNSVARTFPETQGDMVDDLAVRNPKEVWKVRVGEIFPETRRRHAWALRAAQHIPGTRSSVHVFYRFYHDDFGLRAHTGALNWYQWLGPRLYLRADYRLHRQNAVAFWRKQFDGDRYDPRPRTADSDLAEFLAHQWGGKAVVYLIPPGSPRAGPRFMDLGYARYQRTNGLHIDAFTIGYGQEF